MVSRCPCRYLKTCMRFMSDFAFMGRIKIPLLLYSYSRNRYLFTLFEVTGNLPVKSVVICILWLMILVNALLVRCASGVISGLSSLVGSCCLVDLMFLFVWCMLPLDVVIDGGRFLLIKSIFKLGYVAKYTFFIAWTRFYLDGLKIVV